MQTLFTKKGNHRSPNQIFSTCILFIQHKKMESSNISERINKNVNLICKLFEKFGKKKITLVREMLHIYLYITAKESFLNGWHTGN